MPYPPSFNRSSSSGIDPVNLWFFGKLFLLGWRVFFWGFGFLFLALFIIADQFNQAIAINGAVIFVWSMGLIFLVCIALLIVRGVFRLLQFLTRTGPYDPANRPTMNQKFVQIGMVPNPPEPWFDGAGQPLYTLTPSGWVLKATAEKLQAPRAPVKMAARGF
jgi:hypothetical protein